MSTVHDALVQWAQQAPGGVSTEAFDQLINIINVTMGARDAQIAENLRLIGARMGLLPAAVNIGLIQSGLVQAEPGELERLGVQYQEQVEQLRRNLGGGT